ncbi:MAG: F0F1 ATP synthase subunit B [Flavobacteriaceae bacterium]|nr:F0F1 ATP synthase subunit B [Flavobacteriaceae bacterium]
MDLINPGFGLVFWTAITFLILLYLLTKFAWKPILGAVNERENSIKEALASAESARKEMAALKEDNARILQEGRAERDQLLKEARSIKEKMIAEAEDEAKEKAHKIITQAQAGIQSEKQAAIAEIKREVAILSVDIAEKILKQNLESSDQQAQLVNQYLENAKLN